MASGLPLEMRRDGYDPAEEQTARRNDLLGVSFTQVHPDARTRYVLYAPGLVATGIGDSTTVPPRP